MCIIAYYKKGTKATKERIEYMMRQNPDGVGLAWNTGKKVFFTKGIATAETVWKAYNEICDIARDVVFHSRIATSGGISASKCHPYPVTGDAFYLDKTNYCGTTPVVFHNGVFSIDIETGLNDSQTFVKKCVFPIYKADEKGLKKGVYDAMLTMATRGSRLVIMYPDEVRTFGTWQEDDGGVMYSNSNYKPFTPKYYTASAWDDYDGYWGAQRAPAPANGNGRGGKYDAKWWERYGARGSKK